MSISTDFSIRTHEYVPSLDGVRGVSVLLILFFHGQLPGFGKAFIGVDIFFVLSGYLITKILVREYDRNKVISLVHFYQRRILRLFPALVLMSILFTAYCAVFLPDFPTRLWETAEALLYISNWSRAFSLGTSRYLGHTWSLSIEEQFYLLWPIVLIAILRLRRGYEIAFCMTLTFVVSAALWRLRTRASGHKCDTFV